eukprot:m.131526 g.131526  ORF g.131526 m.131526 type:complete len:874 (-) comp15912_c1_seq13:76-2697(-)
MTLMLAVFGVLLCAVGGIGVLPVPSKCVQAPLPNGYIASALEMSDSLLVMLLSSGNILGMTMTDNSFQPAFEGGSAHTGWSNSTVNFDEYHTFSMLRVHNDDVLVKMAEKDNKFLLLRPPYTVEASLNLDFPCPPNISGAIDIMVFNEDVIVVSSQQWNLVDTTENATVWTFVSYNRTSTQRMLFTILFPGAQPGQLSVAINDTTLLVLRSDEVHYNLATLDLFTFKLQAVDITSIEDDFPPVDVLLSNNYLALSNGQQTSISGHGIQTTLLDNVDAVFLSDAGYAYQTPYDLGSVLKVVGSNFSFKVEIQPQSKGIELESLFVFGPRWAAIQFGVYNAKGARYTPLLLLDAQHIDTFRVDLAEEGYDWTIINSVGCQASSTTTTLPTTSTSPSSTLSDHMSSGFVSSSAWSSTPTPTSSDTTYNSVSPSTLNSTADTTSHVSTDNSETSAFLSTVASSSVAPLTGRPNLANQGLSSLDIIIISAAAAAFVLMALLVLYRTRRRASSSMHYQMLSEGDDVDMLDLGHDKPLRNQSPPPMAASDLLTTSAWPEPSPAAIAPHSAHLKLPFEDYSSSPGGSASDIDAASPLSIPLRRPSPSPSLARGTNWPAAQALRTLNVVQLAQAIQQDGPGPTRSGTTLLHHLAMLRQPPSLTIGVCIRQLLEAGVELEAQDAQGMTPLLLAAHSGNAAVMGDLLRLGADINSYDTNHTNVLGHACQSGVEAALGVLAPYASVINWREVDKTGKPPLHWLLAVGSPQMLRVYAEDLKLPLSVLGEGGVSCWHVVVKEGRSELVAGLMLLDRGGATLLIMEPSEDDVTPLQLAELLGDRVLAHQLEECIASLRKPDESLTAMAHRLKCAFRNRIYRSMNDAML